MERRAHGGLNLDVCASCKGVWFDHAELRSVWSLAIAELNRHRTGRGAEALAVGGDILLESLFWAPGLTLHAGAAVAQGLGTAAGAHANVSVDGAASAAKEREVLRRLKASALVQSGYRVSGEDCFVVQVICRQIEDVNALLADLKGTLAIQASRTAFVLETVLDRAGLGGIEPGLLDLAASDPRPSRRGPK
jgi:hypothetical protein